MNYTVDHGRRGLAVGSGTVLACAGLLAPAALAAPAAPAAPAAAAPAPGATACVGPLGLVATGNQHPNAMTLRIVDDRLNLVDSAPI